MTILTNTFVHYICNMHPLPHLWLLLSHLAIASYVPVYTQNVNWRKEIFFLQWSVNELEYFWTFNSVFVIKWHDRAGCNPILLCQDLYAGFVQISENLQKALCKTISKVWCKVATRHVECIKVHRTTFKQRALNYSLTLYFSRVTMVSTWANQIKMHFTSVQFSLILDWLVKNQHVIK